MVKGLRPRVHLSITKKLQLGLWPWSEGSRGRLPEHYKSRFLEKFTKQPVPVHWKPDTRPFSVDERTGERKIIQNVPIPVLYPKESNDGLWGGEGIIKGYVKWKSKRYSPKVQKFWKPLVMKKLCYSEILDKWMTIPVTDTTLMRIDEAYGFDFYILKTHEVDLKSQLGMDLKREMLLTLARKSLYPNDPVKREKIYNRYKSYIIPESEAEWVGLTLNQACRKQEAIESKNEEMATRPLKEVYKIDLISKIQEMKISAKESQS